MTRTNKHTKGHANLHKRVTANEWLAYENASFRSIQSNYTQGYCFALVLQWLIMLYFIDSKGTLSQMAPYTYLLFFYHPSFFYALKPPFLCSTFQGKNARFFPVKIVPSSVPFRFISNWLSFCPFHFICTFTTQWTKDTHSEQREEKNIQLNLVYTINFIAELIP